MKSKFNIGDVVIVASVVDSPWLEAYKGQKGIVSSLEGGKAVVQLLSDPNDECWFWDQELELLP